MAAALEAVYGGKVHLEVVSRATDGCQGEYLVYHGDGEGRAWVLDEARMDEVHAEMLVNGGELLPVGEGWVVLCEMGTGVVVKGTRVDRARAVAEKVLAMLEGRRWVVGLCGGDVDTEGRMRVRGKRVVGDQVDQFLLSEDDVDLLYSSDEALVAA